MTAKASRDLKIARGTLRKGRSRVPANLASGHPAKPEWLGVVGSAKWDEVVLLLEAEGKLSPVYGDFIAQYCLAHEDLHRAEGVIAEQGEYCQSEKGGVYQHPAVGVKHKAIDRIMKFGRRLGMDGISTQQVLGSPKQEATSKKNRFFA